jgi:hypothetical protein
MSNVRHFHIVSIVTLPILVASGSMGVLPVTAVFVVLGYASHISVRE